MKHPRLEFDQPVAVLVRAGKHLVDQLDGPEFAPFYEGCRLAFLDGKDIRDELDRVTDELEASHLEQGGAKVETAKARDGSDPHVATLVLFVEEAHDKLGIASKLGVPGARELRSAVKISTFRNYGVERKALHVLDLLVLLRADQEKLLAFGFNEEFLTMGQTAANAVAPATTLARQKLDTQKGRTSRVAELEKALERAVVRLTLAHRSAERRLGRKLPALDLTLLTAHPKPAEKAETTKKAEPAKKAESTKKAAPAEAGSATTETAKAEPDEAEPKAEPSDTEPTTIETAEPTTEQAAPTVEASDPAAPEA